MKRPSFQFYPGDWQANQKLRRCSHAEKGVWIDVMCLMHDSEKYGVLRWPLADIAQAVGCKVSDLRALRTKGVLKGADAGEQCEALIFTPRHAGRDGEPVTLLPAQDGPLWFSSRMVVDEYIRRKKASASGHINSPEGTPHSSPNHTPMSLIGEDIGATPDPSPYHASACVPARAIMRPPAPSTSSPKESKAARADGMDDAKAKLFSLGKEYLIQHGSKENTARSFIGSLCKEYRNDYEAILQAFTTAEAEGVVKPEGWIVAYLKRNRRTPAYASGDIMN